MRAAQTRRERAQTQSAELQADKDAKPLLQVKPIVEQTASFKDIREIRVEAHFQNVGLTDVEINRFEVEVYQGMASTEMQ